jgi:thioredoxin 1
MLNESLLRLAIALALIAAGSLAWRIVNRISLRKARAAGTERAALPEGFVPGKPGILSFGSPDCRSCVYAQKPALKKLSGELGRSVQILEFDVTQRPELAQRYGILSLPTLFIVDAEGNARRVNHGFVPSAELRRQLSPYLSA